MFTSIVVISGTIGRLTIHFIILGVGIVGTTGIDLITIMDGTDDITHGITGIKDLGITQVTM